MSDPAVEEEILYASHAMHRFTGTELDLAPVSDETTILKFHHLQVTHNLGELLFELIAEYLQDNGLNISTGTIVDTTIISVPSSNKDRETLRDPEMHQTKKGSQLYRGMKEHMGVDSKIKHDACGGGDGGECA